MSINPPRQPATTDRLSSRVVDTAATLFADARRRALLGVLGDMPPDRPVELDDLAERVARAEADGPPREDRDERVLWSLHRDHLPLLEAAGLVEVDRDDGIFVTPDRAALDGIV